MRKVLDILDKLILALLIIILSAMLVVGTMKVIWRYVLEESLSWSEELMRFLYVWATMLGVGAAIRRKSMACIDSFLDFIGTKSRFGQKVLHGIAMAVQIFVFGLLIFYGYQFTVRAMGQHSPAMGLAMFYVYAAFPLGGAIGMLYTLEELYDTFIPKPNQTSLEG